jgi:hypothetical protein
MTRALVLASVLALGLTPALAQAQRTSVPVSLPPPPAVTNQTSSMLFDANLAISRAQQANPQAAQSASFQYVKAVQQYRSGDTLSARATAVQALSAASQAAIPAAASAAAVPPALLAPAPAQVPGTQGGLYGADAPAIDADSFLALARGIIADCAARHDRNLAAAQRYYAQAAREFAARAWQGTRIDAKTAIDLCAQPQPAKPQ